MEAVARTQSRVKQPVQHYVISLNEVNAKARVGVLNSYTGGVVSVAEREIGVELDSGRV